MSCSTAFAIWMEKHGGIDASAQSVPLPIPEFNDRSGKLVRLRHDFSLHYMSETFSELAPSGAFAHDLWTENYIRVA
ncbi:hypothetical protein GCM10011410_16980 [Hoyosella rhizosphaerae]|uniref:Uncharacterized protein n=1 Tax=Hoyosella rhizosphaerae TaxID=1755582 RepID=A0A916UAY4_9ACTN|nr:hypothetical protein GCM10011410_16980 [Hoyosella rhizosphaerae]